MSPATDPYRTLGLPRGAPMAEVKRAYRRLAKENHPDAAGPAALPRFLAIQAAYEQLAHGTGDSPTRTAAPRASAADPVRADATHRAYGGRSRRARPPGGQRPASGPGAQDRAGTTGSGTSHGGAAGGGATGPSSGPSGGRGSGATGGGAGAGADTMGSSSAGPGPAGDAGEPRKRGKATLGSTSYDGADATPFEPDWSGASWYGTTSGTYWTINPKEYADPRKHGPEYQARARRAARPEPGVGPGPGTPPDPGPGAPPGPAAPPEQGTTPPDPGPGSPPRPMHTTTSWWGSPATEAGGSADGDDARPEPSPARATAPRPTPAPPRPAAATGPAASAASAPDLGAAATDLGRALTDERSARGWWRVAQAVIGWLPIAFGLGWFAGEITGCGRASASCDGTDPLLGPVAAIVALGLLLLVPRLAAIAAGAALGVAIVVVPAAAVLSAASAGEAPPDRSAILGVIVAGVWMVGIAVGIARRIRAAPPPGTPGGPVS